MPKKIPTVAWQNFEQEVFEYVRREATSYSSMLGPRSAKVYHKKSYFSKDRQSNIVFDVSMEVFDDSDEHFSLLFLYECKDYPTRKVRVDEVEEFWSKMQQVAANKGYIFTRVGFEIGCVEFAKSKRIGLSVLNKKIEERIAYAQNTSVSRIQVIRLASGVLHSGYQILPKDSFDLGQIIQADLRP